MIKDKVNGFTLIEMLVVTTVFASLAILISSMVLYSMRASKKGESAVRVRGELENAVARIERGLREAKLNTVSVGSGSISFVNQDDLVVNITCQGSPAKLAMNGQDLTNSNVKLIACDFSYTNGVVNIVLTAGSAASSGMESDHVTVNSKVVLRNY